MITISFWTSDKHARHLRRAARLQHKTLSEYLRDMTKPETLKHSFVIKKHPISDLPYDASPDAVVATDEEIKAALTDFP